MDGRHHTGKTSKCQPLSQLLHTEALEQRNAWRHVYQAKAYQAKDRYGGYYVGTLPTYLPTYLPNHSTLLPVIMKN